MALKGKVTTALLSDVGKVRDNNEDAIAEDPELGLLVLADGMGGYNAGEIASGIAVTTVLDVVRREWPQLKHGQVDAASGYSTESLLLREALGTAHTTIYQAANSQPQCAGMGTTAVVALLHDDRMSIAYAGDSRLYRLRGWPAGADHPRPFPGRGADRPRPLQPRRGHPAGATQHRDPRPGRGAHSGG